MRALVVRGKIPPRGACAGGTWGVCRERLEEPVTERVPLCPDRHPYQLPASDGKSRLEKLLPPLPFMISDVKNKKYPRKGRTVA